LSHRNQKNEGRNLQLEHEGFLTIQLECQSIQKFLKQDEKRSKDHPLSSRNNTSPQRP
jgi:hypothetical protein